MMSSSARVWTDRLLVATCMLLPLAVYWRTAYPSVHTLDVAEYSTAVPVLGIVHSPGYVTYLLLARLALLTSTVEPARFLNLLSGLAAAATVAGLAFLVLRLTGSALAALGASLFYAFTHFQWVEAIIATPYTFNTLWMVADLALIQGWRMSRTFAPLGWSALLYGLQPGLHMSSLFQAPGFAVLLAGTDWRWFSRPRRLAALAVLFVAGLSLWVYLPLRDAASPPLNYAREIGLDLGRPHDLLLYVSAQPYASSFFGYPADRWPAQLWRALSWLWLNYLGVGVILGITGWLVQLRRDRVLATGLSVGYLLHVVFYANYSVSNRDTMFLPSYLIWAVWIGEGLAWLLAHTPRTRKVPIAAFVVLLPLLPLLTNYERLDSSQDWRVRELSVMALDGVAPDSLIMGFWLEITPLQYLSIVEKRRADVELMNLSTALTRHNWGRRELTEPVLLRQFRRAMEGVVLERLQRGQSVYLFQELSPDPVGWLYVREGALLRAQLKL